MGMPPPRADLNVDPELGAGLPPLEFKGKRTPVKKRQKRRSRERDDKGRRFR